jgi:hypothetical protein
MPCLTQREQDETDDEQHDSDRYEDCEFGYEQSNDQQDDA